jgi:hypothetical protein
MAFFGFPADSQVGFAIDDFGQAFAHQGVVINQQDARALLGSSGSA